MDRFWKYLLILIWLIYLLFASVSIFLNGFLLNRDVLANHSSCSSEFTQNEFGQICTEPRHRVVLLIVDALMYDFAVYNETKNKAALFYENKMPVFSQLRKQKPRQTLLYKFIADPPTTTMQRLKGLTTGSLPTFIDAGSNFATYEIDEDNFLDQLQSQNRSIVFMGDDTWSSLYPNRFTREFPFPSFNVWDLDTVDRGVEKNLMPELKQKDWDLLIAHFLGVDHCGHRYNPNHPEMSRKLNEMNSVIRDTVENLDNNTVLIVIGDHGMTASGNHGGDSAAEVTAALFVYSPEPLLKLKTSQDSVNQVDLIPTLAAILGSPIPFSSLGSLIVQALPQSNWEKSFAYVRNNINQVHTYVATYAGMSSQFTEESVAMLNLDYRNLLKLSNNVKSIQEFKDFVIKTEKYFKTVKSMCEEIWIQFNVSLMFLGLFFIVLSIVVSLIITHSIPSQKLFALLDTKMPIYAAIIVFTISTFAWFVFKLFLEVSCAVTLGLGIAIIIINFSQVKNGLRAQRKHCDKLQIFTFFIVLFNLLGMFSNSYIVEEGTVVTFLFISLIFAIGFSWQKESSKKVQYVRPWLQFTIERLLFIIIALLCCVAVRVLSFYWQCREEQERCQGIFSVASSVSREVAVLPFMTIPIVVVYVWLKNSGNLVSFIPSVMSIKVIPIIVCVLTFIYWVLESLPKRVVNRMVPWDVQYLPMTVYALLAVAIVCLVAYPLCIHIVPARKSLQVEEGKNIFPHIFQHIKTALNEEKGSKHGRIPAVYGLPTVFSASFLAISLFLLQLLFLLQGSMFSPALIIMFLASGLLLAAFGFFRIHSAVLPAQLLYIPWYLVTTWGLFAWTCFYGTGHQATIPGIQWQAAFVGTSGEFSSNFIPGLMVTISTFSSHVWLGLLLPLLLVCPLTVLIKSQNRLFFHHDVSRAAVNGEVFIYEHSTIAAHAIFVLCIKYILFQAMRVCAAMCAALILRRHLMVWKIFAPKLIFEAAGMGVSSVSVLIGFLLFSLLSHKLDKFMSSLENDREN